MESQDPENLLHCWRASYTIQETLTQTNHSRIVRLDHQGQAFIGKIFIGGEDLSDRFVQEVMLLEALDHPHIIKLVDRDTASRPEHYVMEERGESVRDLLDLCLVTDLQGSLDTELTLHILKQTAKAIQGLKPYDLIHRDIKPANLLWDKNAQHLTLIDLGLARVGYGRNPDDCWIGTPNYLSPEVARGKAATDKSDVYSLGATAYELLSRDPPYGYYSSANSLLRAKHLHDPEPLHELTHDRPEELCDLIMRMLERNPQARPCPQEVIETCKSLL